MEASAQSEIMRGGPKQSLRQKMPKEENIAWQHNTGGNKKGNLLDKRERKLCKDRDWRELAKGNVAPTMRRTIRYLGSVKKTFHFLCSLFENQTTTIRYTNSYSTRGTLSVHVLFRYILPFLPMLLIGKNMFNTWSSSKNIFSSLFSPCDFGSAVFFYLSPIIVFYPILEQNYF